MWLAKPSSYGTFIHYFLPVSRRTGSAVKKIKISLVYLLPVFISIGL